MHQQAGILKRHFADREFGETGCRKGAKAGIRRFPTD
jgi:hypothetical protein